MNETPKFWVRLKLKTQCFTHKIDTLVKGCLGTSFDNYESGQETEGHAFWEEVCRLLLLIWLIYLIYKSIFFSSENWTGILLWGVGITFVVYQSLFGKDQRSNLYNITAVSIFIVFVIIFFILMFNIDGSDGLRGGRKTWIIISFYYGISSVIGEMPTRLLMSSVGSVALSLGVTAIIFLDFPIDNNRYEEKTKKDLTIHEEPIIDDISKSSQVREWSPIRNDDKSPKVFTHESNKKVTGNILKYFDNGQKKEEGFLRYGRRIGQWVEWYENGQIKSQGEFKDGFDDGVHESWYENGKKKESINWKFAKPEGYWTCWYKSGDKKSTREFKNGKPVGFHVWFYPSRVVKLEKRFKNGKKRFEAHYNKNGEPEGL
jgi:antitoxin component YwqK of YwqJK toxin-antitoxin module